MHVAMYIHAYFSNCMHIYMTYSNCICMMVYVMYIHFRICIHTWHIHGLEYTWHFLFQSCSNLAIIDVDWFSISDFTNTTWRFIGMWDWIYMCASSFVCSMTKFLCFYDIYFYMGWFRVTLVLEMLALTICTGQMECATFKWCVFNCKSPGDVRLCQFLDHITRYNLLSDGDLTLVMVIKLCLLNMIFFLNSLNLPLQTLMSWNRFIPA
jgi:hypothetical protein